MEAFPDRTSFQICHSNSYNRSPVVPWLSCACPSPDSPFIKPSSYYNRGGYLREYRHSTALSHSYFQLMFVETSWEFFECSSLGTLFYSGYPCLEPPSPCFQPHRSCLSLKWRRTCQHPRTIRFCHKNPPPSPFGGPSASFPLRHGFNNGAWSTSDPYTYCSERGWSGSSFT